MGEVPADFGARLRAARAYADNTRAELAQRLNVTGASESTIRDWEHARGGPNQLIAEGLIPRLAGATGLPEEFFWGASRDGSALEGQPTTIERKLDELLDEVRLARAELAAHDAAVVMQIEAALAPTRDELRNLRRQ